MHSPLQPLITLQLSDRLYIYLVKCQKMKEQNEKAAAKKRTDSAALRESLTFKLNSLQGSVNPQISSQQQPQNNGKFSS
jgi:hypothetical protein